MPDHQATPMPLLEALRDFFMAQNASDLAQVYQLLAANSQTPAPTVDDWKQVEFAFNRLFVGPMALEASPYASVYLDPEPQLMGQSTLKIRQIYEMLGLTSPQKNVIPDDHVSFELDAYRQLTIAMSQVESDELQTVRHYFLVRHLKLWVFEFINQVKAAKDVPEAILFVVDQLAAWLKQEIAAVEGVE